MTLMLENKLAHVFKAQYKYVNEIYFYCAFFLNAPLNLFEFCRMLQEDKQLFQLYNDLVVSGVITAEEFWTNRTQVD